MDIKWRFLLLCMCKLVNVNDGNNLQSIEN